jgi:hypothetical protein
MTMAGCNASPVFQFWCRSMGTISLSCGLGMGCGTGNLPDDHIRSSLDAGGLHILAVLISTSLG